MNRKKLPFLAVGIVVILAVAAIAACYLAVQNQEPQTEKIRVACVGDSLTQGSSLMPSNRYPTILGDLLGANYSVGNFGAGSTTVLRISETPYMNTSVFQDALNFEPNIVVIMLGTNDAQPSLHPYNASFIPDYVALVNAFQALASKPKVWVVLPPPLFSNKSGAISPEFLATTIIPDLRQAADEAGVPVIDVFSALSNHPEYFYDGEHLNGAGTRAIAKVVYEAITAQVAVPT